MRVDFPNRFARDCRFEAYLESIRTFVELLCVIEKSHQVEKIFFFMLPKPYAGKLDFFFVVKIPEERDQAV